MSIVIRFKCDTCGLEFKTREEYKKHTTNCKNTDEYMADQYKSFAEETLEDTEQGLNEIY